MAKPTTYAATQEERRGYLLIAVYGFGAQANRVQFWHATKDGAQFKDERGASCFDYPDLVAAIDAAESVAP